MISKKNYLRFNNHFFLSGEYFFKKNSKISMKITVVYLKVKLNAYKSLINTLLNYLN